MANYCPDFITGSENITSEVSQNRRTNQNNSQLPKRPALAILNVNRNSLGNHAGSVFKKTDGDRNLLQNNNYSKVLKSSNGPGVQMFSIFEDKANDSCLEEDEDVLPKNVISMVRFSSFQENKVFKENSKDSFMVLDLSVNEQENKYEDIIYKSPYSDDIYLYLSEMEQRVHPRPTYIRKQPDITNNMRCVLVDWLAEVCEEYKLHSETLYLAVAYVDRFLSCMSVLRGKLQLVGTASMFIAAKYEEVYPPELKDFVYVTDDTYTKKQVLRMEHLILKVLSFDLAVPTAYFFLQHFCSISESSEIVCFLSQYICELSLLEAEPFLTYLPSEIAAASLALANYTLGYDPWSERLEKSTGYKLEDLKLSIDSLYKKYSTVSKYPQQAISEKYKSSRFRNVTAIQPPEQLMS